MEATLFDSQGRDRVVNLHDIARTSLTEHQVLWVDVNRLSEETSMDLGHWLGLSALALSSLGIPALGAPLRRPRVENFGSWIRVEVQTVGEGGSIQALYFLVGPNWIVTVHDGVVETLDNFKRQVRDDSQLGTLSGASFLAAILDGHLTNFFRAIERLEAEVDAWDDRAMSPKPEKRMLPKLRQLRQKIAALRRVLVPHREVYTALLRPDIASVFGASTLDAAFPTLASQMERAVDSIDNARELVLGSFEMYSAQLAQKNNDVMRLLTVVTVLLLPIGTLAGVLGMNFQARFFNTKDVGFFIVIAIMLSIISTIGYVANKKGWLHS
jgi:magnesium transporter